MALTIMGGLFVATLLTLLSLPALYALWFGAKRPKPVAETVAEPQPVLPLPEPEPQLALPLGAQSEPAMRLAAE